MMKIQGAASRARRHSALVSVSAIAVMLATPAYAQDEVQTDQIADEAASTELRRRDHRYRFAYPQAQP